MPSHKPRPLAELPNENPDIIHDDRDPNKMTVIPPGIAGLWHTHKRQGLQPSHANVLVPGATFAMILLTEDDHIVNLLIRTDIRDGNGVATSTVVIPMRVTAAMQLLNDNFIQTRIQG